MIPTVQSTALQKFTDIACRAAEVLRRNERGTWTKPAPHPYPHQWSWDRVFIAIGLAHLNVTCAAQELLTLFDAQWASGKVPHTSSLIPMLRPKATSPGRSAGTATRYLSMPRRYTPAGFASRRPTPSPSGASGKPLDTKAERKPPSRVLSWTTSILHPSPGTATL